MAVLNRIAEMHDESPHGGGISTSTPSYFLTASARRVWSRPS